MASTLELKMKAIDHNKVEELRKLAFELTAAEQYKLAFFIAENLGFELVKSRF